MGESSTEQRRVRFGIFEIDFAAAELRKRGRRVKLEAQPFQVLCELVRRPGELVTRDELRKHLWPEDTFVEFDHSLGTAVMKVRQALGDSPREPRYIETAPRQGYRFIAHVESLGIKTGHEETARPRMRSPWFVALTILMVVVGVGTVGWFAAAGWRIVTPAWKVVPLTTYPGFEYTPSFSPDGSEVAFTWCRAGDQLGSSKCDVFIKQIGVEKPFELSGGPAEEISPAWSPDGGHIAFARVSPPKLEVVLVPHRGGPERVVAEFLWESSYGTKFNEWRHIDWMPDSRWLVATGWEEVGGPARLYAVNVETGAKHRLTDPPGYSRGDLYPSISPGGRTLAFSRANSDAHLLTLAADMSPRGEPVRLGAFPWGTAWTADGQEIVATGPWSGFWRMRPGNPGRPARLPLQGKWAASPAISARGGRLAYSFSTMDTNIWRLELGDSKGNFHPPERLIASTAFEANPDYSPDGRRIAFMSDRSGSPEIWICDRGGKNQERLTSFGEEFVADPKWSPNGHQIAFYSSATGNREVYVVSAGGGEPRQLTHHPGEDVVTAWSADGNWIYFHANRGSGLQTWRISPDGGEAQPFPEIPASPATAGKAHPSPDGRFLYFTKDDGIVYRTPAATGADPVPVITGIARNNIVEIFDDGIYYLNERSEDGAHDVLFKDLATGQVTTLGRTAGPAGFWSFTVSPDRREALYLQFDQTGSDLMLVEGFH